MTTLQEAFEKNGKIVDTSQVRKIEVKGAYGRTYEELKEALFHWEDDKDFVIVGLTPRVPTGRYINKTDVLRLCPKATVTLVNIGVLYYGKQ